MGKVELKYRTFDQLLNDVMGDLTNYSLEGMIEPQQLIKVAKKVSKDLGLRIYKTKETVLELDRGKLKLPNDFYVFNHGLICGEYTVSSVLPQGTHMEEVPFPTYKENSNVIDTCADTTCPTPEVPSCSCGVCSTCTNETIVVPGYNPLQLYGNPCVKPRVFMDCKGASWELIQIVKTQTRTYKQFLPLKLVSSAGYFKPNCPNLYTHTNDKIWIKDGFLHSNLKYGNVYFSYEGMLEDEDGNLLVLDHDIINEYYEYALKERILENLLLNGEDVERNLNRMAAKLRTAKIDAKSIVNTPNFEELKNVHRLNRVAYENRYVNMFKSYNWF